jgi:hypothetical protein
MLFFTGSKVAYIELAGFDKMFFAKNGFDEEPRVTQKLRKRMNDVARKLLG